MSADSPRRLNRGIPAIVPPQVVSDRSIVDSVAGFINDCTALSTQHILTDPKDTITWARFEQCADISDITYGDNNFELEGSIAPPLLLILGYGLGIQVWAIPENGEAIEVLSWRHGNVTALRILPTPISADIEMVEEPMDNFMDRRPLIAISDGGLQSGGVGIGASGGQHYCAVNFVSLRTGAQVKTIKFKNNVLDILANRTSIVITFPERIAVFDARTLDDRLSITTCYPSPGINPNPIALGSRWLAYSENKLLHSKRSAGGCDGEGVPSYTATVLNAAKSLGKGLRELGEQMAAGLTGSSSGSSLSSKTSSFDSGTGDIRQPGVVTIMDIKYAIREISPTTGQAISINGSDPIIAHFIAHSEAIVALEFDSSGMLLLTADKRGHDFHIFRIQPHLAGSHLSAIHHLYILHRGDTTAKVQNIAFALDSRWVAVSTLRGTTHVFPITPYGGSFSVRTHGSLHVVNKLSRFHRSAGLSCDQRSSSPISHSDSMLFNPICMPYNNPTLPPFPRPLVILPLAQLRQPTVLNSPPSSATQNQSYQKLNSTSNSSGSASGGRQRLSSLSDDSGKPLSVCAVFAKPRAWLLDPPTAIGRDNHKIQRKSIDSLFIMAGHGALIQYDLDTKLPSNIAKEKICDDSSIELEVEPKAQWNLGRKDFNNLNSNSINQYVEIQPPLSLDNWLMKDRNDFIHIDKQIDDFDDRNERWLSQVEIITHAGPHRRLWMGPQFVFKTYNTLSGSNLSHIDTEAVEIGIGAREIKPGRSSPMNMPLQSSGRSAIPVLIESGSYSSIEQSPKLMDRFKHDFMDADFSMQHGESRLKEDLADAMRESPSVQHIDSGFTQPYYTKSTITTNRKHLSSQSSSSDNDNKFGSWKSALSSIVPDDYKNDSDSQNDEDEFINNDYNDRNKILIEKIVNPLGTVTTLTRSPNQLELDEQEQLQQKQKLNNNYVIHANCDESLFRPVVTIFCNETDKLNLNEEKNLVIEKLPEPIGVKLIVPVIEKKQKNKNSNKKSLEYEIEKDIKQNNEIIQIEKKQHKLNKKIDNTTIKTDSTINVKEDRYQETKKPVKSRKNEEKCNETKLDTKNNIVIEKFNLNKKKVDKLPINNENSQNLENEKDNLKLKIEKNIEIKINNEEKDEDECVQQKLSKDEDSESFESLENIDINETEKFNKFSDKLTEILSDNSITKISKVSKDLTETKQSSEHRQIKDEEKPISISISDDIIDADGGIVFFDNKFAKDSPPLKLEDETKLSIDIDSDVKLELVDYSSLLDSLYEQAKPIEEIEEVTVPIKLVQSSSKTSTKAKLEDSKLKDKKQFKYHDDSSDSCETVTVVLPSSKKNKKKNSVNKTHNVSVEKKLSIDEITEKPNEILKLTENIIPELPKLSFDLPPLSPLEPLDNCKMNLIENPEEDNISLINFESPSSPSEKENTKVEKKSSDDNSKKLSKNNIIFALCGSLHYENENKKNNQTDESMQNLEDSSIIIDCPEEYQVNLKYKSLTNDDDLDNIKEPIKIQPHHHKRRQKDTKPLSDHSSSSSSSSETEDTSSSNSLKDPNKLKIKLKLNANDDEELRPLIDGSLMTSSVSSSKNLQIITKKKKNSRKISFDGGSISDSGTKSIKRDSLTKIIGVKNQTIKTLPLTHHNQSGADSSSEQAATTSEDEQIVVLPTLLSPTKKLSLSDNKITGLNDDNSSIVVGSLEDYLPNISSSNNLSKDTNKNIATINTGNNNNGNSQQNLKKKSKRKKR